MPDPILYDRVTARPFGRGAVLGLWLGDALTPAGTAPLERDAALDLLRDLARALGVTLHEEHRE